MDALELMQELTNKAKQDGMTLTEYLATNYGAEELDQMQDSVNKDISERRKTIETSKNKHNLKVQRTTLSNLSIDQLTEMKSNYLSQDMDIVADINISGSANESKAMV